MRPVLRWYRFLLHWVIRGGGVTVKRPRFKQSLSLKERLASFAKEVRAKAADLPAGPEKDDLLFGPAR